MLQDMEQVTSGCRRLCTSRVRKWALHVRTMAHAQGLPAPNLISILRSGLTLSVQLSLIVLPAISQETIKRRRRGYHQPEHERHVACATDCLACPRPRAERGVDCSGVQRVERPTRDVLVVFDDHGDRRFVGFGGENTEFADTVIAAEALPLGLLGSAKALVTGTLGLAFPTTAQAMHRAVDAARSGPAVVRQPRRDGNMQGCPRWVAMAWGVAGWHPAVSAVRLSVGNSALSQKIMVASCISGSSESCGLCAGAQVVIDVNWRPVFWEDPDHARDAIMPYLEKADIVKVSDEEVEWLLGVPAADALFNPEKARARARLHPSHQALDCRVSSGPRERFCLCWTAAFLCWHTLLLQPVLIPLSLSKSMRSSQQMPCYAHRDWCDADSASLLPTCFLRWSAVVPLSLFRVSCIRRAR